MHSANVSLCVGASVVLALITIGAVVGVQVIRPSADNTSLVTTIIGFSTPVMVTLLVLIQRDSNIALNSQLSELMRRSRRMPDQDDNNEQDDA